MVAVRWWPHGNNRRLTGADGVEESNWCEESPWGAEARLGAASVGPKTPPENPSRRNPTDKIPVFPQAFFCGEKISTTVEA